MKDNITLVISRGKTWLNILHQGKVIGKIMVSEFNRGNQVSLTLSSDKTETVYKIDRPVITEDDESQFNREECNI